MHPYMKKKRKKKKKKMELIQVPKRMFHIQPTPLAGKGFVGRGS